MQNSRLRFGDLGKEKAAKALYLDLYQDFDRNKSAFECIYKFIWVDVVNTIMNILNEDFVLKIRDIEGNVLYPFEINSFRKYSNLNRVFSSYSELIKSINLDNLNKPLRDEKVELIGIDESKLDVLLQGSIVTYLKSVAFRMFKKHNGEKHEAIGPLIQSFKLHFESEEKTEKKNQFITYLWNMYVIYLSAINSLEYGYKPIIILHGPLIRAIGGFTDLHFSYEELKSILNIEIISEEEIPTNVVKLIKGDKLINDLHTEEKELFNRDSIKKLMKRYDFNIWKQSIPYNVNVLNGGSDNVDITIQGEKAYNKRSYSAISIYFFLLRKLYELAKQYDIMMVGVVEDISKAREFSTYLFPNLFFSTQDNYIDWLPKCIKEIIMLKGDRIKVKQSSPDFKREVYKYAYRIIKNHIQLRDIILFTQLLNEGDYTSPMHVIRYLPRRIYDNTWGIRELGIDNDFNIFIEHFFPYPEYKVIASYLRTTPHREPIRIEFFDVYTDYSELVGLIYYLSLFYPNYGIPIILKYADMVARTPKKLIDIVVSREIKKLLSGSNPDIDIIMRIMNQFSRNFFRR